MGLVIGGAAALSVMMDIIKYGGALLIVGLVLAAGWCISTLPEGDKEPSCETIEVGCPCAVGELRDGWRCDEETGGEVYIPP